MDVHRRLLRLLEDSPNVAIFPYLICPLEGKAVKYTRQRRIKREGNQFCFTFASFMAWELGDRRLRLGIVETFAPRTVEQTDETTHVWVVGVYSKHDRAGKDVFFFDDSSQDTLAVMDDEAFMQDMVKGQRKVVKLLKDKHRIAVDKVWWGGRKEDVGILERSHCVEYGVRFMERFAQEVEENGGREGYR